MIPSQRGRRPWRSEAWTSLSSRSTRSVRPPAWSRSRSLSCAMPAPPLFFFVFFVFSARLLCRGLDDDRTALGRVDLVDEPEEAFILGGTDAPGEEAERSLDPQLRALADE